MTHQELVNVYAFEVLMSASKDKHIPKEIEVYLNCFDNLFMQALWMLARAHSWRRVWVNGLRKCSPAYWYVDLHHKWLSSKGAMLPHRLQKFSKYNDWKGKKLAEPWLRADLLWSHTSALSDRWYVARLLTKLLTSTQTHYVLPY